MQAYAQDPRFHTGSLTFLLRTMHVLSHFQCCHYCFHSMHGIRTRHTAGAHVAVPNGLDLLDTVVTNDVIKSHETGIQLIHQPFRTHCFRNTRKALHVREHHRYFFVSSRCGLSFLVQLIADHLGKNIQQKTFDPNFLPGDLTALLHHLGGTFLHFLLEHHIAKPKLALAELDVTQ